MSGKTIELSALTREGEFYILHVWGPGITLRKSNPACRFPTVAIRKSTEPEHFMLIEGVKWEGPCDLRWDERNQTARVYTQAALKCVHLDCYKPYGGQVYNDSTPKEQVIAFCKGELSCLK